MKGASERIKIGKGISFTGKIILSRMNKKLRGTIENIFKRNLAIKKMKRF